MVVISYASYCRSCQAGAGRDKHSQHNTNNGKNNDNKKVLHQKKGWNVRRVAVKIVARWAAAELTAINSLALQQIRQSCRQADWRTNWAQWNLCVPTKLLEYMEKKKECSSCRAATNPMVIKEYKLEKCADKCRQARKTSKRAQILEAKIV